MHPVIEEGKGTATGYSPTLRDKPWHAQSQFSQNLMDREQCRQRFVALSVGGGGGGGSNSVDETTSTV